VCGNHLISVTEISPHGHRRNGATLCPACKITPTRSSFVRLSVKSGRFVRSGQIAMNEDKASMNTGKTEMTASPYWQFDGLEGGGG
jgi:hypothetical protein